jgi:hypothetical protein
MHRHPDVDQVYRVSDCLSWRLWYVLVYVAHDVFHGGTVAADADVGRYALRIGGEKEGLSWIESERKRERGRDG